MNAKKPTFQQADSTKRFNERYAGEKQDKKAPHFLRGKKEDKRPFSREKTAFKASEKVQQRTELTMDNARGTANVKVVIKRTGEKEKQKKTGPLSPRAPEKIKKNRAEEIKVYGENTCLALFAQRPESIVRVWTTVEMAHRVGELFSYLAANKKVYHVVDNKELALVSGTEHHNGICMLVKKPRHFTLTGYLDIPRQKDALVLLDNVHNAHNIGGIVRTCAVYGVKGLVLSEADLLNSAAAMRVAEGGAEYIHTLLTNSTEQGLTELREKGYQIVHLSQNKQAKPFAQLKLSDKVVFVLSESAGENLVKNHDDVVNLSLANPLNAGLNVAVATGVLLAKWAEKSL
ncbi:rRNA methyltransferase [Avibacterium sp. 20-126]|uniref:TrmH family RNA methyltransferase n=1 Tax=Avibacterium sp. 20-126 TaxID=2911524 RepID=UPI00218BC131|nr:rRNA methyltransferase [Avibacterium sp. 20-126]